MVARMPSPSAYSRLNSSEKALILEALRDEIDPRLVEAAADGVLTARDRFVAGRGVEFFDYARYWITLSITKARDEIGNERTAVHPIHGDQIRRIREVVAEAAAAGEVLTFDALSARTGIGAASLATALVLLPQMEALGFHV